MPCALSGPTLGCCKKPHHKNVTHHPMGPSSLLQWNGGRERGGGGFERERCTCNPIRCHTKKQASQRWDSAPCQPSHQICLTCDKQPKRKWAHQVIVWKIKIHQINHKFKKKVNWINQRETEGLSISKKKTMNCLLISDTQPYKLED